MTDQNISLANAVIEPKLVIGTYPWDSESFQTRVWKIIYPGLMELAQDSENVLNPYEIRAGMAAKIYGVYLGFMDMTGKAQDKDFQEIFTKKMETPEVDFVGFLVVQPWQVKGKGVMDFHIPAAYINPRFRGSNVFSLGLSFVEAEMRKLHHTGVTMCTRQDVSNALQSIGYKATTMNYRKVF